MNKRYFSILMAIAVFALPLVAWAAYTGPTGAPTTGNPPGPVWLSPSAPQTGDIRINGYASSSGDIRSSAGDLYLPHGKAIRVDRVGSAGNYGSTLQIGNWTANSTGTNMLLNGNLYVRGWMSGNPNYLGTVYTNTLCLNNGAVPGTDCRSTWPSGAVTDVWVDNTGDAMTGSLSINSASAIALQATGTVQGIVGYGTVTGVIGSGGTAGGYFRDANGSGNAYVGVGDYGIEGQGNSAGGHFTDLNNTPTEAYVGYGTMGILANGTSMGGNFSDTDGTSQAYVAYNGYGLQANGDTFGVYGTSLGYGSYGQGSTAGGYFRDTESDTYGYIGYGSYGVYASGTSYGVRAYANTTGVRGEGNSTGVSGYGGATGVYGNGTVGTSGYGSSQGIYGNGPIGGRFTNNPTSSIYVDLATNANAIEAHGGSVRVYDAGVIVYNPNNASASIQLGWSGDVSRLYYGGSGVGATNGFQIQRTGQNPVLTVSDSGDLTMPGTLTTKEATLTYAAANTDSANPVLTLDNPSGGNNTLLNFNVNGTRYGALRVTSGNNVVLTTGASGAGSIYFRRGDLSGEQCILAPPSATLSCNSDRRLKENISDLTVGLDAIMQLKPSSFVWKTSGAKEVGFIAQDVQEVLPNLVTEPDENNDEHYLNLSQTGMIPYMVKAIQELKTENDGLKAENAELLKRIEAIEAKLK